MPSTGPSGSNTYSMLRATDPAGGGSAHEEPHDDADHDHRDGDERDDAFGDRTARGADQVDRLGLRGVDAPGCPTRAG